MVWSSIGIDTDQYKSYFSTPRIVEFATNVEGQMAYANFYPPANGDFVGPSGERPPLLLRSHGMRALCLHKNRSFIKHYRWEWFLKIASDLYSLDSRLECLELFLSLLFGGSICTIRSLNHWLNRGTNILGRHNSGSCCTILDKSRLGFC